MKIKENLPVKTLLLGASLSLGSLEALARVGGGGGHSSHGGSGGGYSSSSHGGSGYSSGGSISGGEFFIILIIVAIVLILKFASKNKNNTDDDSQQQGLMDNGSNQVFPEGLPAQKVATAFMELQQAWQQQDLSKVRHWISDGVYQRFTAQFAMMKKLSQRNYLSNIRIHSIYLKDTNSDGAYETADIAISFSMDDDFLSEQYPDLNESYEGDTDTEYWTFIKRKDAKASSDLYAKQQCPNCGASLENMLGEVSRCSNCQTLTNNASYDWVLSEITQVDDYAGVNKLLSDNALHDLVKNDPLFAVQRVEDIASNVFMQIMEVMGGDNNKKLSRFADKAVSAALLSQKEHIGSFIFDRLYLNDVTLKKYNTSGDKLNLEFDLIATYQRVRTGAKLTFLDDEIATHSFKMTLSKDLSALKAPQKEVSFSYECSNCGAPYNDTTNDVCSYCEAPVIDTSRNWVLTGFSWS